ncbi:flagellar FlbD family protein [Anoxynatronum sibiricum]|uniref:Flagellar FlbD family protein n=1 Tax=Anoxynatronum sibiricum TaxID=210623 RepID=A0ABU9VQZ2_9CLOT
MIRLKRLNQSEIIINAELVQSIEETPDTVITLTNGQKIVVVDSVDEILEKVIQYKRNIHSQLSI